MGGDRPYFSVAVVYFISAGLITTNPRGATHWKLNENEGLVQAQSVEIARNAVKSDPLLSILAQSNPPKLPPKPKPTCERCNCERCNAVNKQKKGIGLSPVSGSNGPTSFELFPDPPLHCGDPVNETVYDYLEGIANRKFHPPFPEPEVAMIFKKSELEEVDLALIENNLMRTISESPNSVVVCNQIGNFWRIKGNTYHATECFRKALSFSPNNADVLLNLARVLYNLNYLDDAVYLTRRSLEMQPADHNCWLQHFTLGEILKAGGQYEEAVTHFRHALDLNPSFHPAEAHLKDIGAPPDLGTNAYTFLIIGFLVIMVLVVVYLMTVGAESKNARSVRKMRCDTGRLSKKRVT